MFRGSAVPLAVVLALVAVGGCRHSASDVAPSEPPVLPVSKPVQRQVTDFVDFTGRTSAVQAVDVRPRVTGYLTKMPFKEGSEVKEGDLLFEIDPRPYQAQLDQAQSQVTLTEAQYRLARANFARDVPLVSKGYVSHQEYDQVKAAVDEATARIDAAKAALEVYKLNLAFTKVTSPIEGQISRYYLTLGNLVNQDQTLLTTVVSLDPIYLYFDLDEPTLLRLRKARSAGTLKPDEQGRFTVLMALQGEDGFPHSGTVNFVNNQVNPATGSIAVRAVFDNPKLQEGVRMLSPGMFVRVRLQIGQPYQGLLVIDRAIGFDQGLRYLYVIDRQNKVQYRRVTTGALQEDGLRVITQGLGPDERVLVGGLQQVRPQMKIQPEETTMPTLGQGPPVAPRAGAGSGNSNAAGNSAAAGPGTQPAATSKK